MKKLLMFFSLFYIILTVASCKNKTAGIMDILDDKAVQTTYDLNVFSEEDMSFMSMILYSLIS